MSGNSDESTTGSHARVEGAPARVGPGGRGRAGGHGQYDYRYTRLIKTAVSIPDSVFQAADGLAQRLGVSRSELYARAVSRYVVDHRDDGVTEMLDRVYGRAEASQVDPALYALQAASLGDDRW